MIYYLLNTGIKIEEDLITYSGIDLNIIHFPISKWNISLEKIITAWDASYKTLNKIVRDDFSLHVAVNNTIQNLEMLPDVRRYMRNSTNGFNLFKNNINSHCFSINLRKDYEEDTYSGMHYSSQTGVTYLPSYTTVERFNSLQLDIPPVWLRRWSRDYIEEVFLVEGGNEDDLDHDEALNIRDRYYQQITDS